MRSFLRKPGASRVFASFPETSHLLVMQKFPDQQPCVRRRSSPPWFALHYLFSTLMTLRTAGLPLQTNLINDVACLRLPP